MATINNIGGFVHTIADNPPWREAVQVHPLGQERPDRFTEFVQLTDKKNRLVNERLERLETTQTETSGSIGWTAAPATSKGNDYERKVRYRVMAQSPARFELNNPYRGLPQNDPATRPQSPLPKGAGSIAKAAHAHPWDPGATANRR